MMDTRKRQGGGSPGAIKKSTDESEFTQNDSPSAGQIPPPPTARLAELTSTTDCPPPPSVRNWETIDDNELARLIEERQELDPDRGRYEDDETRRYLDKRAAEDERIANREAVKPLRQTVQHVRDSAPPTPKGCIWTVEKRSEGIREFVQTRCKKWKCEHCEHTLAANLADELLDAVSYTHLTLPTKA